MMELRGKKLTIDIANKIYDILVKYAEAPETNRESFVHHYTKPDSQYGPSPEWRFCGKYGMAGKFWWNNDRFYISGRSDSEGTAKELREEWDEIWYINTMLSDLKLEFDAIQ